MVRERIYNINRELSLLEFNRRVLEEAQDPSNKLFERLKFLSIVSSNMDEFFMIRVSSIIDKVLDDFVFQDSSGLTPKELYKEITLKAHTISKEQQKLFLEELMPLLKQNNIHILKINELNSNQLNFVQKYYKNIIYPVLTPMAVDNSRPFPFIQNRTLNIFVLLRTNANYLVKNKNQRIKKDDVFAIIQVPGVLERFIALPSERDKYCFIMLEDIIIHHLSNLFNNQEIIHSSVFRITRDADLTIDEQIAEDILEEIEKSLKRRRYGEVVRLEISKDCPEILEDFLKENFELDEEDVYKIDGPLDYTFLMKFVSQENPAFKHLKDRPLPPVKPADFLVAEEKSIFDLIKEKDILIHTPFESFEKIIEFVRSAATDPDVLAIKMTLYRVTKNSPIVKALEEAADNGKQVTVVIELKARFDEENNINWAKKLEKAGCHVVYGLVHLKVHSKAILVVRKEEGTIRRYVHLSTGNYNENTARLYTDISLFTSNVYFGTDVSNLFNTLTGLSQPSHWYKIGVSPINLREKLVRLIRREAKHKSNGHIIAKMNALVDDEIIDELYDASSKGVKIDLIIRGICCLRPGIKGISENIRVISIVGRFLEHSRIFYFKNNSNEEVYLSSADWMPRNLDRRIEIIFPIENERIKERIKRCLNIMLKDNTKARELREDGTYVRVTQSSQNKIDSQILLYETILKSAELKNKEIKAIKNLEFVPIQNFDDEIAI
ncbi:polyphosphate kinase [Thermodesulfobium acidiphilum]|uniref:Polyphosphate kinase n=1 Tax=Thermodesulfobium acidiphilum TaxID=1794699 RepID=A0A2R4VZ24_THEAF|nr:RNA degradosome polyphosphate kinase [Thermodesulfobium acidiphilum]AWB09700.1 polyphosphate kinase [Thermodesulfobium acidiphilum]